MVCTTCGEAATAMCTTCEQEFYCSRNCQLKHWIKHKKVCRGKDGKAPEEDDGDDIDGSQPVPMCAGCGEKATPMCTTCEREFYCRPCTMTHFVEHKKVCLDRQTDVTLSSPN